MDIIIKLQTPTITQMMPPAYRHAFFARILGIYAFKFSSLKEQQERKNEIKSINSD